MNLKQDDLSIVVPNVDVVSDPNPSEQALSMYEIIEDTSRAGQICCEPLAIGLGCLGGTACCLLTILAQEERNNKPATRHDVVHAEGIRRADKKQREAAGNCGVIICASIPRALGRLSGAIAGLFYAGGTIVTGTSKTKSDSLCCITRKTLDESTDSICSGIDFG